MINGHKVIKNLVKPIKKPPLMDLYQFKKVQSGDIAEEKTQRKTLNGMLALCCGSP